NSPLGIRGKGFLGESLYAAENPKVGATFTYFFKEDLKTRKEKRQEEQDKLNKDNKDVFYPTYESLKEEEKEEAPYLLFTIRNEKGDIIRKLKTAAKKGVNRLVWDFRYPSANPININPSVNDNPFQPDDVGQLAAPGNYTVTLSKSVDGVVIELAGPEKFEVKVLPGTTLPATDRPALVEWQRKAAELQRSIAGASTMLNDANNRTKHMKASVMSVAKPNQDFMKEIQGIEEKIRALQKKMNGDRVADQLNIDAPPSISSRLFSSLYDGYGSTSEPTTTMKDQLRIAGEEFEAALAELKGIFSNEIKALEQKLEAAGAPYTPGRMPEWRK
ncbi:MAG: glycosyl hydrolase, partial [Cytophagales bacterium]